MEEYDGSFAGSSAAAGLAGFLHVTIHLFEVFFGALAFSWLDSGLLRLLTFQPPWARNKEGLVWVPDLTQTLEFVI